MSDTHSSQLIFLGRRMKECIDEGESELATHGAVEDEVDPVVRSER